MYGENWRKNLEESDPPFGLSAGQITVNINGFSANIPHLWRRPSRWACLKFTKPQPSIIVSLRRSFKYFESNPRNQSQGLESDARTT